MLRIRVIGALEVELDGAVIRSSSSQRPWAVFAYLALRRGPVSRSELASTFWPDVLDRSSRASLRSALWALRRELGDRLVIDRERAGLRPGDDLWVDMHEFERLADDGALQAALELCRGELLEGAGDEWVLAARQRHRERVIELLEQLAQDCQDAGRTRAAIEWTRREVQCDPLDEDAHRRLIARLDAAGDRAGALRTYRTLAERLRRELSVAPSPRTRQLVGELRAEKAPAPPLQPLTPLLPMVGRERELAELEQMWRSATGGGGAAAVIRGEAGIGKSRLAGELRNEVRSAGGLAVACAALDLGGTAPFSLWAELIRELLPALPAPPAEATWPEDLAALAAELPAHFGRSGAASSEVAPDLRRTRLFEAVVALLDWAAGHCPLLLIVEDVHSADRASLELTGYVARRAAALPVMLLLTRRELPRSADADGLEQALRARGLLTGEIALGPLPPEPLAALTRAVAALSETDVTRVLARADGNPLLAVETARALARGEGELAANLRTAVRATLAPAHSDVRGIIELAAVASRPLAADELGQLPFDDPDESAAAALQTGLVVTVEGRLRFSHGLLRDAVYEEIAEPRRRGLHLRWAQTLLATQRAGAITRAAETARHLRMAGRDRDAVPQLVLAAADARALAALEQAAGYLEEATAIAPDRSELWLELGEIAAWRGRRDEADEAFDRAIALRQGGEPLELARAWLARARAYHGPICIPRAVLDSCGLALELLDRTDLVASAERREALAACAWAQAVAGSVDEAERLLAELGSGTPDGDLQTYDIGHARALALMRRGRFADSYAPSIAAGEAIARAGRPDLAYGCWANAAGAAAAAGELERADRFIERGLRALDGHGLQSLELHLLAARSFVLTRLGRLADAQSAVQAEQRLAERLGQPELLAMASHDRGLVALEMGEHERAASLLSASLTETAPISRPLTRLALAEARMRSGDLQRAEAELRSTVLEPVRPSDFPAALVPRLARVQGLIALARQDFGESERRLTESIAGWERLRDRTRRVDSMTIVLADLGRPVVGLVEPERELDRVRGELEALRAGSAKARVDAVIP